MKDIVDGILGSVAQIAVTVLGWVMNKVIAMIIGIAQYSDFVNNKQIEQGWMVIRDICNMFFILILLFIAFAVILRMESYSIKKSLPKLLVMAVLINFSKTICGILIDFSQVVMLTFIGPITAGTGNFHNVLKIDEYLSSVADAGSDKIDATDTAVLYTVAVLFMLVATIVMISVLIAFVMRVIMFWIYIVLSPLAFLLSSFSGGQKYASQFWGDFTKYLISGPALAFFLWLSLYVLGELDTTQIGNVFKEAPIGILVGDNFAKFVMAIGMLVGGLTISAQLGGMGASWGASTVSNLKNKGLGYAKSAAKLPWKATKGAAGFAGGAAINKIADSKTIGKKLEVAAEGHGVTADLARSSMVYLRKKKKERSDKADEKTKHLRKYANIMEAMATDKSVFTSKKDQFDSAFNIAPHSRGKVKAQEWYDKASREDLNALKPDVWRELGRHRLDFDTNPNGQSILTSTTTMVGKTASAAVTSGGGTLPTGVTTIIPSGNDRRFKTGEEVVKEKNELKERKENFGGFGRGLSNMIVTDFNVLRKAGLEGVVPDPSKHRGVSFHNKEDISKVAGALIKSIDERIKGISSGEIEISTDKQTALKGLEGARARLSDPKQLENLQLVDVLSKRGDIAHEIIHGAGAEEETTADHLEGEVLAGRMSLKESRLASVGKAKTPEAIIKLEGDRTKQAEEENVATAAGRKSDSTSEVIETKEVKETKVIEKIKEVGGANIVNAYKNPADASSRDMALLVKTLSKGFSGLSAAQIKTGKMIQSTIGEGESQVAEDLSRLEQEVMVEEFKKEA